MDFIHHTILYPNPYKLNRLRIGFANVIIFIIIYFQPLNPINKIEKVFSGGRVRVNTSGLVTKNHAWWINSFGIMKIFPNQVLKWTKLTEMRTWEYWKSHRWKLWWYDMYWRQKTYGDARCARNHVGTVLLNPLVHSRHMMVR